MLELTTILLSLYGIYTLYRDEFKKNSINIELTSSKIVNNKYESTFVINNPGEAISKDDIFENFTLKINNNNIKVYEVCTEKMALLNPNVRFTKLSSNTFIISFDLLNQNDNLEFKCTTDKKIDEYLFWGKAKNLIKIKKYHYKMYPILLYRLNIYSIFGIILGVFFFLDAIFLILKNKELQAIYEHIKTLNLQINKNDFTQKYKEKYNNYDVIFKVLPKKGIFNAVEESVNNIDNDNIEDTKNYISRLTSASVQYWLRSTGLILGPITFIISLITFIYSIFKYSSF